ncbi:DUF4097 family beta strand repeat-containing protein [uncultured Dubosiella sp.]|uniref:DUF4097 family beta strand repeat-containing protein n=3 Tax=uncultured Dubosiella sp. TaxID=1937011 RepID=UPI0026291050|nr:DUF4097 family beta strand repeat-containing protein [uncultured Dubosiella sp.]
MNKSYYEQLKSALLSRHSASEADEMIEYLQEAAQDSGLSEEEYLASLGTIEDVISLFEENETTGSTKPAKDPVRSDLNSIRKLLVSIPNGSLRLSGGTNPGITCTKGNEALNIRTEEDKLVISAKPQSRTGLFKRKYPEIDLEIVLPDKLMLETLEIHTVNTTVSLHNMLAQSARFDTVNGDIRFANANLGHIRFDTVNGTIDLNMHTDASIKAETVCARITSDTDFVVDGIPGAKMKRAGANPDHVLKISSVSGKIRFNRS